MKTFIFTLICTNWLLPTIFKIISSLLVVMGEEKRCFLDKIIPLEMEVAPHALKMWDWSGLVDGLDTP